MPQVEATPVWLVQKLGPATKIISRIIATLCTQKLMKSACLFFWQGSKILGWSKDYEQKINWALHSN